MSKLSFPYRALCADSRFLCSKIADMIIKTTNSPLLIAAVFLALRGYLPMAVASAGNGTHPNTMEGRGFWSTIPMPVTSHFAGDESRQNYAVWWQRATIALKQWLSIVHTETDITVSRQLVSSKSFDVTGMVALDRKCIRQFFMLISAMFVIWDRSREETLLYVSGGSEVAVGWKHVSEDLTRSWAFTIECRDLNTLIILAACVTHFCRFSLYLCQGFGFKAPTNEAIWALAKQNAMDGKAILLNEG